MTMGTVLFSYLVVWKPDPVAGGWQRYCDYDVLADAKEKVSMLRRAGHEARMYKLLPA